MPGIFDTHCHLMAEEYEKDDIANILEEAKLSCVSKICNVGYDMASSEAAVRQAFQHKNVYAIVGVHPDNIGEFTSSTIDELSELANSGRVVGIGEIGLDYFHNSTNKAAQKKWFIKQLDLAKQFSLPVSVHCREAYEDCFEILLNNRVTKGIMHCYAGDLAMAQKFIDLGLYLSFNGVVTFKNAKSLQKVVQAVPVGRIVLETDAPYLTPEPYRGDKNYPKYISYVARKIAEIKKITPDEVIRITSANANRVFNLK